MNDTFEPHINPTFTGFDRKVCSIKKKDQENVGFDQYMQDSTILQYSTDNEDAFYEHSNIKFPEEIARHIEQPRSDYKLGFLKNINHVWLARGTILLLWDFCKKDSQVFRYEANQVIEHVDIAAFATSDELVVCTRDFIYLHTISQGQHKIQLATGIAVDSAGVVMSDVVATKETKRVFMKGDDGHLYELILTFDNNGAPKNGSLSCLTMNPILRYLTMFFKSPPVASLKSLALDEAESFLYMLLSDSSIHVASIGGACYVPLQRYIGHDLETICLVQDTKKPSLMAVAKNGDRLFFQNEYPDLKLKFTRTAPSLPGSILFNDLTDQHADISFYQQGIFASILSKSEKHYLVLSSTSFASSVETKPVLVEDVYSKQLDDKVWSIIEEEKERREFILKAVLEPFTTPRRQISTLTTRGVVRYYKQHIADYLERALQSVSPVYLHKFEQRYGVIETCYVAHLLACSPRQTPHAIDLIRQSIVQQDGLLLYFARLVKGIWTADIKSEKIPKDKLLEVQEHLKTLVSVYQQHQIPTTDVMDLVMATIESISLICFTYDLEWEQIVARLESKFTICTFHEFVSTDQGGVLAQNIVYAAIKISKLSNASNNFNFIGNFLGSECSKLLGQEYVIYFKGIENLYAAYTVDESDKKQALQLALQHFKSVISICDNNRITALAQQFADLKDHYSAIEVAFTSYSHGDLDFLQVCDITTRVIHQAIEINDEKYTKDVITKALKRTNEEIYHYAIYEWLDKNDHHRLLASLEIPTLFTYIQTQKPDLRQKLILLEYYYAYRNEFAQSADAVYQLATDADQVGLSHRVNALKKACEYLPRAEGFSREKCESIERKYKVAQVQHAMCESLIEQKNPSKKVLQDLNSRLIPEYDLLECAYTQSLYEEGLTLMHILDEYNWEFQRTAWENIISLSSTTKEKLQSKLKDMANRFYPSIPSFPVYIIYQILQTNCAEFGQNFPESVLIEAGIPSEVENNHNNNKKFCTPKAVHQYLAKKAMLPQPNLVSQPHHTLSCKEVVTESIGTPNVPATPSTNSRIKIRIWRNTRTNNDYFLDIFKIPNKTEQQHLQILDQHIAIVDRFVIVNRFVTEGVLYLSDHSKIQLFPCKAVDGEGKLIQLSLTDIPSLPRAQLLEDLSKALGTFGIEQSMGLFMGTGYAILQQSSNVSYPILHHSNTWKTTTEAE
ncbi:hypothetical protein [Parasitella parasitica]|uniref:Nucleoporin Nup133/Nup155-like N-terminal domain-containing protein n=1 Tax=Parasitella parasitica TaxID=35722 RepID=A0A0B7NGF1_9FUNG|nr:hypothetical protein [Parasitella parasitica]